MTHAQAMAQNNSDKPDRAQSQGQGRIRFYLGVDFPMFKYNKKEKRWESEHHPFTSIWKKTWNISKKANYAKGSRPVV